MKGILIPITIESIRSRKDKTVAVTLGTQELTPEKAGELFSINGKFGYGYISAQDIENADIDLIDTLEPDMPTKSPAQRLRGVLYLMWKNNNEGYNDHNLHYLHYMEEIISKYKLRLPA